MYLIYASSVVNRTVLLMRQYKTLVVLTTPALLYNTLCDTFWQFSCTHQHLLIVVVLYEVYFPRMTVVLQYEFNVLDTVESRKSILYRGGDIRGLPDPQLLNAFFDYFLSPFVESSPYAKNRAVTPKID